jgi:hypothetical protein
VSASDAGRIGGAVVTFLDSPNAGRSATTNSNGEFRFDAVTMAGATLSANAAGFFESRIGLIVDGINALHFTLTPEGPRTAFGQGTWLVGTQIAAGRYYAAPSAGCAWERFSGAGDLTANDVVPFDAGQTIVDILPGDRSFRTNAECGTWSNNPRGGSQSTIPPGTWLVNSQVAPGNYQATGAGCMWDRMSGFRGDTGDIIASDSPAGDGPHMVTISSGDVGFRSSAECGTWTSN